MKLIAYSLLIVHPITILYGSRHNEHKSSPSSSSSGGSVMIPSPMAMPVYSQQFAMQSTSAPDPRVHPLHSSAHPGHIAFNPPAPHQTPVSFADTHPAAQTQTAQHIGHASRQAPCCLAAEQGVPYPYPPAIASNWADHSASPTSSIRQDSSSASLLLAAAQNNTAYSVNNLANALNNVASALNNAAAQAELLASNLNVKNIQTAQRRRQQQAQARLQQQPPQFYHAVPESVSAPAPRRPFNPPAQNINSANQDPA